MAEIPIRVELGSVFEPLANAKESIRDLIKKSIAAYLLKLGIPGFLWINVVSGSQDRFLRVMVNGRYHAPSTELLISAWNNIAPVGLETAPPRHEFEKWLQRVLVKSNEVRDRQLLAALIGFVADVSAEIVRRHPEDLFGLDQAADMLARAGRLLDEERLATLAQLTPQRLVRILRPVLDLRISLIRQVGLLEIIADELSQGEEEEEIAEKLISNSAMRAVRIRLNPDYLNSLIPGLELNPDEREAVSVRDSRIGREIKELFGEMCDRNFWDLGVRILEVVFETDPQCEGATFQIAVNHQFSMSQMGLVPDELIVNAQPEELANLATNVRPASTTIIDAASIVTTDRRQPFGTTKHKRFLEDRGFKPRGPIEFLMICISREVRRQAWCFMTKATVETELALLEERYPDLAMAAVSEITPGRLARVLRNLLREEISIRDLVCILERLLTFDCVTADTLKHIIYDYRLPIHPKLESHSGNDEANLTQYVRSGLKRANAFKNLRGSHTIDVYLLHPEIESSLLDHLAALNETTDAAALSAEQLDRIQAAIRKEAERTALGSWTPAILTSTNIRSFVRSLVADEFPEMSVVSYDELEIGPDYFIQVIAVISIR